MLPVLFQIVIPAGFGKPVVLLAVVGVAVLRALAYLRRSRRGGEKVELRRRAGATPGRSRCSWRSRRRSGAPGSSTPRSACRSTPTGSSSPPPSSPASGSRSGRRGGGARTRSGSRDLSFWILVAALVGSRVYFILVNWGDYFGARALVATPFGRIPRLLAFWEGGLVFYGGFIGAALTAWWYMRRNGMRVPAPRRHAHPVGGLRPLPRAARLLLGGLLLGRRRPPAPALGGAASRPSRSPTRPSRPGRTPPRSSPPTG